MQFQKLGLAIAAILGCASANAFDGTINITGKVTAQTCAIKTTSKIITVTLPDVSTKSLDAAGKTAAKTPFKIQLEGCTTGQTPVPGVTAFFEPGANIENGKLKNTATTDPAENVQIQLVNEDHQPIDLSKNTAAAQQSSSVAINAQEIDLNYYAQYYATDAATAGAVSSTVNYTIVYQ